MSQIQLPQDWNVVSLSSVCQKIADRDHTTPKYVIEGIPIISPKDFTKGGIDFSKCKKISVKDHEINKKRTDLRKSDILFSRIGTIGQVRFVDAEEQFSILHTIVQIRANEKIVTPRYLYYYLQSAFIQKRSKADVQSMGTPDLGIKKIREFEIPIPPVIIQKKIVQKLDYIVAHLEEKKRKILGLQKKYSELISEKRNTINNMKGIAPLTERCYGYVLDEAFKGKLTKTILDNKSSAELLEKIRIEGYRTKNPNKKTNNQDNKSNQNDLEEIDQKELPDLPKGWVWVRLSSVCSKITDGTHNSPPNTKNGEIPYITAKNIRPWGIDISDLTYVRKEIHNEIYSRCNPEKGDVLYIKDGATTGLAAVNEFDFEFSMLSSVALLKPNPTLIDPYYLKYYLNSPQTFKRMTGRMSGVAITRIILDKIRNAEISLPPLEIQKKLSEK